MKEIVLIVVYRVLVFAIGLAAIVALVEMEMHGWAGGIFFLTALAFFSAQYRSG